MFLVYSICYAQTEYQKYIYIYIYIYIDKSATHLSLSMLLLRCFSNFLKGQVKNEFILDFPSKK